MNDIRDALRKAGLVDKKDEKRYRHEEKVRKKQLGREGREAERQQQDEEAAGRRQEEKARIKAAQKEHDREQKLRAREHKVFADLKAQALRAPGGPRRFHYRDQNRYLPYLAVSPEVSHRLEAGEYALVESPEGAGKVLVVPRELAGEVRQLRPELVLHFAGGK